MNCPQCQAPMPAGTRVCPACGFSGRRGGTTICTRCRRTMPDYVQVCPHCGSTRRLSLTPVFLAAAVTIVFVFALLVTGRPSSRDGQAAQLPAPTAAQVEATPTAAAVVLEPPTPTAAQPVQATATRPAVAAASAAPTRATATSTATPSPLPSETPTATPTPTASETPTTTPTETATAAPTATDTPVPTGTVTAEGSETPTPSEPAPADGYALTVAADKVHVRAGPSTSTAIIGDVLYRQTLRAVGRTSDGQWVQVCCVAGQRGWMALAYVDVDGAVSTLPVVP